MNSRLDREQFKQDVRDVNHMGRRAGLSGLAWLGIFILVVALIGGVIWGVKVAVSDVEGQGDATRQTNSAANRLQAQAKYAQLHEGIKAADANLDTFADTYRLSATEKNLTDLTGAQAICRKDVAEYNAMATNVLTAKWIPAELPSRVGDDQATDCKPSTPLTPSK